ncbi:prephenate dehydrogenase/arogenate dehydrogenase family protein [Candidatus Kaiserbacteria bacterium]|nr:prephenate dehydrogenase/arogenate dehydrogenase family protein [Candidatus Kaiserbacteria bacterium]
MITSVGIVGYGAFGALLHTVIRRFAPAVSVRIHSSRHEPDGVTFFSLEDTASSDALILAVPIRAFEDTLAKVLPNMGRETVLVDVATVKVHTVEVLKRLAVGKRYIATHPMWGPESYEKRGGDVSGFRIVITESTLDTASRVALTDFLKTCGFDVVEMSPEEHDKNLAETLFLTHLIGQIVSRAGFRRTDIDTVSFGHLMDAMESVRNDTELFADVFRYNPYCKNVLERFADSEKAVRELLDRTA